MRSFKLFAVVAVLALVSGCGDTREQRAATGALGGVVLGTVVGAPLVGAAAGGAAGAVR